MEKNDMSVKFFYSRPANFARTWFSFQMRYGFVNTSYLVCSVCWFLFGMLIIYTFILGASFPAWFFAKIATVTIFPMLKVWINWAKLDFFTIWLHWVAWSSQTTKDKIFTGFFRFSIWDRNSKIRFKYLVARLWEKRYLKKKCLFFFVLPN